LPLSVESTGGWSHERQRRSKSAGCRLRGRFQPVAPGSEFLFDRRVDPGENLNLLTPEPAEAGRMRDLFDRHLTKEGAGVVERGVRIDPGIADRLRAMGYLR
jgi:hypothetical protein